MHDKAAVIINNINYQGKNKCVTFFIRPLYTMYGKREKMPQRF